MADHCVGDLHPLLGAHQLVGGERNREAIQQVIANVALLRVVGGDQQRPAGVAEAETFPFHPIFAAADGRQHQVDDAVVEQIELVDVEHAAVGIGEQPGLEHRTATGQGGCNIHSAHQAVFGDAKGDLHEGGGNHRGGCFACDPLTGGVVPFIRVLGIEVAAHTPIGIEDVDRGQQGMQAPGQN